jgi:DNA-directed RNA polymerase beta subunit
MDLITEKYIVYLDVEEELYAKIAATRQDITLDTEYLHMNASAYLSYSTNYLPFCNNNATHRATLSLRLVKQALSQKPPEFLEHENKNKVEYLTKTYTSLVSTPYEHLLRDRLGVNAIVAFLFRNNEEDAFEVNHSAVQRGLFDFFIKKNITVESPYNPLEKVYSHQINPLSEIVTDGLSDMGVIEESQPLITMYASDELVKANSLEDLKTKKVLAPSTRSYLSGIRVCYSNKQICKISYKLSKLHYLKLGDKIGTRTGLKGVISRHTNEIDLPLSKTGIYPSVFISNHVINSRMTLGPLLELYLSKGAVLSNKIYQIEPVSSKELRDSYINDTREALIRHKMDPQGYEHYYDFTTDLDLKVYTGPMKVLLLEQHGSQKSYVRAHAGGYKYMTRQPGEGRKVKGGLRFGQMQNDAARAHCATAFLKDRMNIDEVEVRVCGKCHILTHQLKREYDICPNCNSDEHVREVKLPYAFVLLTKILRAGHIQTNIELESILEQQNDQTNRNMFEDSINLEQIEEQQPYTSQENDE